MSTAIIGAGIAGIGSALTLQKHGNPYMLYEKCNYIGGHAYSHKYNGKYYDMGFIFGKNSYGGLRELYTELGIQIIDSYLEFSSKVKDGKYYVTDSNEPYPTNIQNEIDKFIQFCNNNYDNKKYSLMTFESFIKKEKYSKEFVDYFIFPSLSILFISKTGFMKQSTRFILNMFGDTKWMNLDKKSKVWTIAKSSNEFKVKIWSNLSQNNIKLNSEVISVIRHNKNKITVKSRENGKIIDRNFANVIFTIETFNIKNIYRCNLLEKTILDLFSYDKHTTILHTDQSILPSKKYRRNFNYQKLGNNYVLNGIMSRIQNVSNPDKHDDSVILTNIPSEVDINKLRIDKKKILHIQNWYHISQTRNFMILIYLNMYKTLEKNNVKFTGSWTNTIAHGRSYEKGIAAATSLFTQNSTYLLNINVHKTILYSIILIISTIFLLLIRQINKKK
tara:strand:- start:2656 stop:3993 length:1338 start_codon:yes stop_codon:yes gene_type:complete